MVGESARGVIRYREGGGGSVILGVGALGLFALILNKA